MKPLKITHNDSNFTIVLPGKCNARCKFCCWKEQSYDGAEEDYYDHLVSILRELPDEFKIVSISGGEPTLSKFLTPALCAIMDSGIVERCVITTNGTNLNDMLDVPVFTDTVNHINISRHIADDYYSQHVFDTTSTPNMKEIKEYVARAEKMGIDTTINCVVPRDVGQQHIEDMINFTREVRAHRLAVRFLYIPELDKSITPVEELFVNYPETGGSECSVCRVSIQSIHGVNVAWKYGVSEPMAYYNPDKEVYELILQQNGDLTLDWAGTMKVFLAGQKIFSYKTVVEDYLKTKEMAL